MFSYSKEIPLAALQKYQKLHIIVLCHCGMIFGRPYDGSWALSKVRRQGGKICANDPTMAFVESRPGHEVGQESYRMKMLPWGRWLGRTR